MLFYTRGKAVAAHATKVCRGGGTRTATLISNLVTLLFVIWIVYFDIDMKLDLVVMFCRLFS